MPDPSPQTVASPESVPASSGNGDLPVPEVIDARAPRRGFLSWVGEHPAFAVAVFVHAVLFVGLYAVQIKPPELPKPNPLAIAVQIDPTLGEEAEETPEPEAEPDPSSSGPIGSPTFRQRVGDRRDETARADDGGVTAAPVPAESDIVSEEGHPPIVQARPSSAMGSALLGQGVPGSDREGRGGALQGGFGNRDGTGRATGVARYGGNGASESAVDAGLRWLSLHLRRDTRIIPGEETPHPVGYWDPRTYSEDATREDGRRYPGGTCPCGNTHGSRGLSSYRIGATGLGALAFLGAGHHAGSRHSPYRQDVERVLDWLILQQNPETGQIGDRNHYNHCMALLALAEAWALTADDAEDPARLQDVVQGGVRYLEHMQAAHGGWGYNPLLPGETTGLEMTITTWCILALRTAEVAGATVQRETYLRAIHFVERMTARDAMVYYSDDIANPDNLGRVSMVATGLFCRRLLGQSHDDPVVEQQVRHLLRHLPARNRMRDYGSSYYAMYIGSLALFFTNGDGFRVFNTHVRDLLVDLQETGGHARGAWPGIDLYSTQGGRVYTTAMSVLTLEVYYRYIPAGFLAGTEDLTPFWNPADRYGVLGADLRRTARDFLNTNE